MTVFEAYITNLGKYAEGQLVGETLKFPATTEEVQSLLKNIGVDGVRYHHITGRAVRLFHNHSGIYIGPLRTRHYSAAGSAVGENAVHCPVDPFRVHQSSPEPLGIPQSSHGLYYGLITSSFLYIFLRLFHLPHPSFL